MQYAAKFLPKAPELEPFPEGRGSHDYSSMTGVKGFVYCPHEFSGSNPPVSSERQVTLVDKVGRNQIYEKHSVCTRLLIQSQEVFGESEEDTLEEQRVSHVAVEKRIVSKFAPAPIPDETSST